MTAMEFHHGGVSVPDLDAAVNWYCDVLGFEVESRFRIEPAGADVVIVRLGRLRFELFEVEGAMPLPEGRSHPLSDLRTHGNKHLAFQIDNLDEFLVTMTARKADVVMVVREAFGNGCFLRDCAGNLIEFVEKPPA